MAIHAYNEIYLDDAQRRLGEAFDFAMVTAGISPGDFSAYFVKSDVSKQFENGNARYISGMNGCELAKLILEQSGLGCDIPDVIYIDRSPEYWSGWILAFYQWHSGKKYSEILAYLPLDEILGMYHTYHEMDVMRFAEAASEKITARKPGTNLKICRTLVGYSQSQLAKESGVPIRQIQLFEQRKRDINKAASETLLKLSKALYCKIEDLMETN